MKDFFIFYFFFLTLIRLFSGLAALVNCTSLALLLCTWKYKRELQLGDIMILSDVYTATWLVLTQVHVLG